MARVESDQDLRPSILDRLIDREPKVSSESPTRGSQHLNRIKEAVKRDLEWLLNSRQLLARRPADLQHLAHSLLTFGMPDFTTSMLSNPHDQDRLRRVIQETIARFDPRLSAVQVTLVEGREFDRSIHFRIDAMLRVEPSPLPVTFDSVLQLSSRAFVVEGEGS
jgi:type VI secretion system protein ImpF